MRLPKSKERLRREAARWLARLQSGRDAHAERKWRKWYEADPAHAAAFDRVRKSYDAAGLLRHSSVSAAEASARPIRPPATRYGLAAAAGLAIVTAGIVAQISLNSPDVLMLATSVGEIRQVRLSDGSKVVLDTATSVEVAVGRSKRQARLKAGRARFQIARGTAPFVIEAGDLALASDGGAVDVEHIGARTRVDVLEGAAEISRSDGTASRFALPAHSGVTALAGKPLQGREGGERPDWTRGMLQFDATPLAAAVELANRYSSRRIVLEPGLSDLKVTGAYKAGDTLGFARAIAAAFDLSLNMTPDGRLVLAAKRD